MEIVNARIGVIEEICKDGNRIHAIYDENTFKDDVCVKIDNDFISLDGEKIYHSILRDEKMMVTNNLIIGDPYVIGFNPKQNCTPKEYLKAVKAQYNYLIKENEEKQSKR